MKPSTLKCLQLLRAHDSVTTHDFLIAGCGSRFGGRLHELRHEHGCVIEEHRLSDRSGSRYTLIAEPETSEATTSGPCGDSQCMAGAHNPSPSGCNSRPRYRRDGLGSARMGERLEGARVSSARFESGDPKTVPSLSPDECEQMSLLDGIAA